MKIGLVFLISTLLTSVLQGSTSALAEEETLDTRIGKLTFESGYPSQETVDKLYDEMDFQRASQAYLWGIPAVGLNEWRKAHFDVFKAKNGEMLSLLDFTEKLGILTPNSINRLWNKLVCDRTADRTHLGAAVRQLQWR